VKYVALDVLVAGQAFRALRLWHSSPALCELCHYHLGSSSCLPEVFSCSCGKLFREVKGYLQHCERAGHEPTWAECSSCGCSRPLPWPSSAGATAAAVASDCAAAVDGIGTSSSGDSSCGVLEKAEGDAC